MKLTCLIVDDEKPALELLERYIKKTSFLELVFASGNAVEALQYLMENPVDIVYLDIQMPELSGIELSRLLEKQTKIIFTTAFDQYALEGYKVNAVDYLLKPFNYEEFLRATYKAKEWFELTLSSTSSEPDNDEFIFVKSEYKQIKILVEDILYFEGLKDYIKIWTKNSNKPILTLLSLKSLEESLSPQKFMRIHRSFIIGLNKINSIERNQVIINDVRITVADQYKTAFQQFLDNRTLG